MDADKAGRLAGSALAGLLAGGLLLVAVSMAASIADRSDVPVEAISGTTMAVAFGAAVLVGIGVIAFAVTKNRDIVLLSALSMMLVLLTIAGLFSIGILVLPFTIGAIYLLVRRTAGRKGLARALLAGPAIAIGLSVLWVVWVQPPLVQCTDVGAQVSSRPWWTSGGSSGESSGGTDSATGMQSDGQTTKGTFGTPAGRYIFSCRGDELVQFRRIGDG